MSAKRPLQFVDTNILVYAHDTSAEAKHIQARELIQQLWQSGNGCVSVQVLQEFYVTVTRKVAKPLPVAEAAKHVADLGTWRIHTPDVRDVLDAIELQQHTGISFWDAMIVQSAEQLGCALLWSEDLNTGQRYHSVEVRNPFKS